MINNAITSKYKKTSNNIKKQIDIDGKKNLEKQRGTKPIGNKWREQQLYNSERSSRKF